MSVDAYIDRIESSDRSDEALERLSVEIGADDELTGSRLVMHALERRRTIPRKDS